jgi:phosphotransferase system HPr-like phosphotransfer protein
MRSDIVPGSHIRVGGPDAAQAMEAVEQLIQSQSDGD